MGSALDIIEAVNPPRIAFLDFPLGHTTGPALEPGLQREILLEALEGFSSMTEPGSVKKLPFVWPEDPSWKEAARQGGDFRLERYDTPQYQHEEDRGRAEAGDLSACSACDCPVCAGG